MSEIFASTDNLFVPIISVVLGMGDFGVRTWLACILSSGAAITVAVIDAFRERDGAAGLDLPGAAALVASAAMYAAFRVRTTHHLRLVSAASLNLLRMCWMGALSTAMLLLDVARGGASRATLTQLGRIPAAQWGLMAAGVCVSGFISASIQFEAMRSLSAAKAQPFSALQPLFAGLFGYVALGEPVSIGTWIGGVLMIGAALLGCSDEDAAVDEVMETPTPEQTISTFPLASRLELVEGALADEVLHTLAQPDSNRGRKGPLPVSVGAVGLGALAVLLTRRPRQPGSHQKEERRRRP